MLDQDRHTQLDIICKQKVVIRLNNSLLGNLLELLILPDKTYQIRN